MDAALVLASRGSPARLNERRLQAFVRHVGLGRHTESKNGGTTLGARVSTSKNAGVLHRGRGNPDPPRFQYATVLCWATFLFFSTWLITHLVMGGRIPPSFEPTNIDCKSWLEPVYSSYRSLQANTHLNVAKISSYLQTATCSSNPHDSAVSPQPKAVLPSTVAPSAAPSPTSNLRKTTEVRLSEDPQNTPASISNLEKKSTLETGRPPNKSSPTPLRDFALNAEYISELTSHPHSNLSGRQVAGVGVLTAISGLDLGRNVGQSPIMALVNGGDNEKSCWLFPGKSGYLGIHLKERISVDKFTIDHLSRHALSDSAILQAPRKVILWGLVDGPGNSSKAKIYRENMGDKESGLHHSSPFFRTVTRRREDFIPLATFEYKLSGQPGSNIQTKELPRALRSLQMDFQIVVLEVVSNWNAPSTCLYRVRVHGEPLKGLAVRTSL